MHKNAVVEVKNLYKRKSEKRMRRKRIIGMKPKENGSKHTAPPCRGCGRGLIVTRKRHSGCVKRTLRLHGRGFSGMRKRLFGHAEEAFPHGGNMGFAMQKDVYHCISKSCKNTQNSRICAQEHSRWKIRRLWRVDGKGGMDKYAEQCIFMRKAMQAG